MISIDKNIELFNIDKDFDKAINSFKRMYFNGNIFIYPTDTIYSIGANPFNLIAVHRIQKIMRQNSLTESTLLLDSLQNLSNYIDISLERHFDLLFSVWPNPVRVIFKLNPQYQEIFKVSKAAFQIPNNRFCLKLLEEIKSPLISIRLNDSKNISCKCYELLKEEYSNCVDAFFFTQKEFFNLDTALIDLTNDDPIILRKNKINLENIFNEHRHKFNLKKTFTH